jgi:hypothetical protein
MKWSRVLQAGICLALVVSIVVVAGSRMTAEAQQPPGAADFQPVITNAFFPLSLIGPKVFEGEEEEDGEVVKTRLESRVLPGTKVIAGVTVMILEEKAYADGELIEVALDYFAQDREGNVWYFGEHVDNYENGKLINHDGQWFAGENGNQPGIIMPAQPRISQTVQQELASGIAEDRATFLLIGEVVRVKAGAYTGCAKTRDFTPLEPGIEEFKWYCPGIGMVKEEGDGAELFLVSVGPAPAPSVANAATVATSVPPPTPAAPVSAAQPSVSPPSTGDAGLVR